jgi:transcriptional regulator with XRE-family HTH domain
LTSRQLRVVDDSVATQKVTGMNPLGELLRSRRDVLRERGITVAKIATKAGLPESTVYEYLRKTKPTEGMPRRETLERLAKGFQLDADDVVNAAKESVASSGADPLQLLLRSAQLDTGRSARQAVRAAKRKGHEISESRLSAILNGDAGQLSERMLAALAAGYDLKPEVVRAAYEQTAARRHFRLPTHIEAQLTPEKWAKLLKLIEQALTLE